MKNKNIKGLEGNLLIRNKILKDRFSNSVFYKIDSDYINISSDEISFLAFIYTLRGFSSIDIPTCQKIISETKKAISSAMYKAKELDLGLETIPLLITSIRSSMVCKDSETIFKSKLNQILDSGIDSLELHIDIIDLNIIKHQLNILKLHLPNQIISISISRKNLSNALMLEVIRSAYEIIKKELIVEVNEIDEITSNINMNTTLQTISTADIINKQLKLEHLKFKKIPIILAGGTNELTSRLAEQCGVPFNGITFKPDKSEISNYSSKKYYEITNEEIIYSIEVTKKLLNKVLINKKDSLNPIP